jgi:Lon protease-like protein
MLELPGIVPVFPLPEVLLLPRGKLPLNIFEPRYVAMTEDVLGTTGRLIGMIQPTEPERTGHSPQLYPVGCVGRVSAFSESDDGRYRYMITLTGVCRFTIKQEVEARRGYRRFAVDFDKWRGDLAPEESSGVDRKTLLATLKRYFAANEISADWDAIDGTPDDRLITTLAMVCPFSAPEKQALLEACDRCARARTLVTLMEIAARRGGDSDERAKH